MERIGAIKRSLTLPVYEPRREDQVLANVVEQSGSAAGRCDKRIFERIIDEMRNLQKMKIWKQGSGARIPQYPASRAARPEASIKMKNFTC